MNREVFATCNKDLIAPFIASIETRDICLFEINKNNVRKRFAEFTSRLVELNNCAFVVICADSEDVEAFDAEMRLLSCLLNNAPDQLNG